MQHSSVRKKSKRKSAGRKCKCGLDREVSWEGDGVMYPVFSCPSCGPKRNEWKMWWDNYKDLWREKENWKKPADGLSCIVGYFCYKYQQFYNQEYTFSYCNPVPYKDKDFVMARRLLAMFNGDALEAGLYLKWAFAKIVKTPKYEITSLGFFTKPEFVGRYKLAKIRKQKITRSTPLPRDFLGWCWANHPQIFDLQELSNWNDLNGLVSHVKFNGSVGVEALVVNEAVRREMLPSGPEYREMEE